MLAAGAKQYQTDTTEQETDSSDERLELKFTVVEL